MQSTDVAMDSSNAPNKPAPTIQSCLDSLVRCLELQSTYAIHSNTIHSNALLHPIHMNNVQQSYKLFQNAIRALRRTLLISISEPVPSARRMTLLRECATNETSRLLARRLHRIARNLQGGNYLVSSSSTLSYETLFPDSLGLTKDLERGASVVKVLEHSARSLGLEFFLDDMSGTDTLSLTMAGNVIVVDFVIDRVSGTINKANFTCSSEDSASIDIDGLLKDDLNSYDWLTPVLDKCSNDDGADTIDSTALKNSAIAMSTFIQHIQALLHLDIMDQAHRTYLLLAWKQSKDLSTTLRASFETEWQNHYGDLQSCVQKGHGVVRTCAVEPHTSVLYHMDMKELSAKRKLNSDPSAPLEVLPNDWEILQHIYDVRVSKRRKHPSANTTNTTTTSSSSEIIFTAFLKHPLPITDSNCRKLADFVVIEKPNSDENLQQPQPSTFSFDHPYNNNNNSGISSNREQHSWIEDIIFNNEDYFSNDVVYDVPSDELRPLRFSLTTRKQIPGFLLTRFSFTNADQLAKATEIIRDQALLNELLRNTFHGAFRKSRPAEPDITDVTNLLEANNLTSTILSVSVHIIPQTNSLALSWMGDKEDDDIQHIQAYTDGSATGLEGRALRIFEKTRSIPASMLNAHSLTRKSH